MGRHALPTSLLSTAVGVSTIAGVPLALALTASGVSTLGYLDPPTPTIEYRADPAPMIPTTPQPVDPDAGARHATSGSTVRTVAHERDAGPAQHGDLRMVRDDVRDGARDDPGDDVDRATPVAHATEQAPPTHHGAVARASMMSFGSVRTTVHVAEPESPSTADSVSDGSDGSGSASLVDAPVRISVLSFA